MSAAESTVTVLCVAFITPVTAVLAVAEFADAILEESSYTTRNMPVASFKLCPKMAQKLASAVVSDDMPVSTCI